MNDEQCKIPECTVLASETWARVPVCMTHRDALRKEALRYYVGSGGQGTEAEQRPLYFKITHRIPWSKSMMAVRRSEGQCVSSESTLLQ